MNHHHLKHSVIKTLFALTLLSGCATVFASEVVGTVTNLSGLLSVRTEGGAIKILGPQSSIRPGDTLMSEQDTYARIQFIDKSEITLGPNAQITIEKFSFHEAPQESDQANVRLIKGGLRVAGGLLGRRGKDRFMLNTSTSSIDMQNATFLVEYVPDTTKLAAYRAASMAALSMADMRSGAIRSDAPRGFLPARMLPPLRLAQMKPPGAPSLAPGLYVSVIDGAINLSNKGGAQNFSAGQFGYTANVTKPPVLVPANPALKFTPPPTFSSSTGGSGSGPNKAAAIDCVVR